MTIQQKKTEAMDKIHTAFREEHLATLKKAKTEAYIDMKHYEYYLAESVERYEKVKKAVEDYENELNQG